MDGELRAVLCLSPAHMNVVAGKSTEGDIVSSGYLIRIRSGMGYVERPLSEGFCTALFRDALFLSIDDDIGALELIDAILEKFPSLEYVCIYPGALSALPLTSLKMLLDRMGFVQLDGEEPEIWQTPKIGIKWRIRPSNSVDSQSILDLFETVFGHRMTVDTYAWKYGHGRGDGVIVEDDGKVIAHCGSIYRDFLIKGVKKRVAQLVDVMVHPRYRGILTRKNPFFLCVSTCIEQYAPRSFGFPNSRHMKLGERIGFYAEVDRVSEIQWSPKNNNLRSRYKATRIDSLSAKMCTEIDALWEKESVTFQGYALGDRTSAWIEYRYIRNPAFNYQLYIIRSKFTKRLLALFVVKSEGLRLELVDLICANEFIPAVIEAARDIASEKSCEQLYTWTTNWKTWVVDASLPKIVDVGVRIPAVVWADRNNHKILNNFFLMPGDSDFH